MLEPFLKWAGGKRWLVKRHLDSIPVSYNRYIEPFLGSAAMFFFLEPREAILADLNPELIAAYSAIKYNWKGVALLLASYQRWHCKAFYYDIRNSQPPSESARVARFIYLNRTCWNGLYRVNLRGEFNVPKGTKENVVLKADNFRRVGGKGEGEKVSGTFSRYLFLLRDQKKQAVWFRRLGGECRSAVRIANHPAEKRTTRKRYQKRYLTPFPPFSTFPDTFSTFPPSEKVPDTFSLLTPFPTFPPRRVIFLEEK
jgi:DNA adenine methylase Dam